jgi:NAD(P)-dependent dehydrogenase (short-subunit alcohol dehydrogenase family)
LFKHSQELKITQSLAIIFGGSRGMGAACVEALAHEVGDVVGYLASSRASLIHGQIIQPNGGLIKVSRKFIA